MSSVEHLEFKLLRNLTAWDLYCKIHNVPFYYQYQGRKKYLDKFNEDVVRIRSRLLPIVLPAIVQPVIPVVWYPPQFYIGDDESDVEQSDMSDMEEIMEQLEHDDQ
jgi:hypothetical protein